MSRLEELIRELCPDGVEWKRLEQVSQCEKTRNKHHVTENAYSITQKGLVPTKEYFGEKNQITSADTSNYYIVYKNWFVYSPSRIDVGSISYLKVVGPVIVSPIDVVFSILNSIKTFGNIVCFRNLQKRVDTAISLFGDKGAGGVVLMKKFEDYYYGYVDENDKAHPGYMDMVEELEEKFPLAEPQLLSEQHQRNFIELFSAILRMRNLLSSFDEFKGQERISERDMQDYTGCYQDLRDEWRKRRGHGDKEDITDDLVFEIELIKQIEINIDYILILVKKYHDTHCEDKEVLVMIRKAINASPELRSKRELIETFIAGVNDVEDVMEGWRTYVSAERERELAQIIQEEKLKDSETRKYVENAFRDGEIRTSGTEIDKLLPPISRFGGGNRAQKKQGVIDKLKVFFDKFFGITP